MPKGGILQKGDGRMTVGFVSSKTQTAVRYGTREIQALYHRYVSIGIIAAVVMHVMMISGYYLYQYLTPDDERTIILIHPRGGVLLPPPPSIFQNEAVQQVQVSLPAVKPTLGIPVAVPDAEVSPDQTIPTQQDLSRDGVQLVEGKSGDGDVGMFILPEDTEEPKPDDFVSVQHDPLPVKQVVPAYPDLARRANIEGSVFVKVLIDKEGRVKKSIIVKSDADIFNEPAVTAAMQFVFTPAIQNDRAIPVWVMIPFHFKLSK
jgi:TonB family protein